MARFLLVLNGVGVFMTLYLGCIGAENVPVQMPASVPRHVNMMLFYDYDASLQAKWTTHGVR